MNVRSPGHAEALRAVAILAGALVLYAGTAFIVGHASTTTARFDQLAAAFLRGELYLPPDSDPYDLTPHAGRLHVPFPPLPALLLLPWVALRGVAAVNAVALSVLCGALSVAFVYLLLNGLRRRGWIETRATTPLWLTLLFAAGSVHWYIAVDGSVCFLGQTCTVLFLALAAWLAVRTPSPWPAGAALALALLGRPSVIGFWPLLAGLAGEHFRDEQRGALPPTNVRRRWRAWSLCSAVPLLLSLSALAAYNYARFGNPLDFGYATQNVSPGLRHDLQTYGQFSPVFIPRNAYWLLLGPPRWPADEFLPRPNEQGFSLLLSMPVLFYLVRARGRRPLVRGAWLATALLLAPALTYYNTGWYQFGYRFALDFLVPLLVLLATVGQPRLPRGMKALILAGIAVNLWGTLWWFGRLDAAPARAPVSAAQESGPATFNDSSAPVHAVSPVRLSARDVFPASVSPVRTAVLRHCPPFATCPSPAG